MAVIIFPFTMELLVIALFSILAVPVWIATQLLDAVEDAIDGESIATRMPSERDRRR